MSLSSRKPKSIRKNEQQLSPKFPTHLIVFLAPAFIIYTLFMIYPLVDSLRMSFFAPIEAVGVEDAGEVFVGFANYNILLTHELWAPRLQGAFTNNIQFFLIHMLVQNPIGLLLAALLSSQLVRGKAVWRTLISTSAALCSAGCSPKSRVTSTHSPGPRPRIARGA